MRALIVDNGSKWTKQLSELIHGETTTVTTTTISTVDTESFDLIVLSGGSNVGCVTGNDLLKGEFDLVKNSQAPIIGICYGAEVIAYGYGGTLEKMDRQHKGTTMLRLETGKEIAVYESHCVRIKQLPDEFVVLGRTDHAIEFFKHKEKLLYGLQFHPEAFVDTTEGDELFRSILDDIIRV